MNDKTPAKQDVANAWFAYRCPPGDLDFDDVYGQEFERFIAEVERAAAEKAWDESGEWLADAWGYPGIKDDAHESNPYRKETP